MRTTLATSCLALTAVLTFGCGQGGTPASSLKPAVPEKLVPRSVDVDLGVLRYDTGDVAHWPSYQLPLEHSFEIPEPPPEVLGPFSAEDIPLEE